MGAYVSLHGWFSHVMDPKLSSLVSSLGYTEIDQIIGFQWGNFVHKDGLLISVSLKQHSFRFDLASTLFVSVPLLGFTDSDWDHLHGLELRVD